MCLKDILSRFIPVSLRNNTSIFFSSSYFTLLIRKKWNYSLIHFMIIYLVISLSTLKLLKYQILHNLVFTCFHGNFHISIKKYSDSNLINFTNETSLHSLNKVCESNLWWKSTYLSQWRLLSAVEQKLQYYSG